eukprot:1161229-Pelagomonas_calceolata.AAC.12
MATAFSGSDPDSSMRTGRLVWEHPAKPSFKAAYINGQVSQNWAIGALSRALGPYVNAMPNSLSKYFLNPHGGAASAFE